MTLMLYRALICLVCIMTTFVRAANAQSGGGLIRDAEIENTVRSYAQPIWRAAGLDAEFVRIYLVNSAQINAFVSGGQNVFINTGLLMKSDTPNEVIGVIAHETGHIAGGHLARSDEALENATIQSVIGILLGTAGAIVSKNGDVAAAGVIAGESMGMRSLFAFSVGQEERADQAGLGFLEKTCQSARGMLAMFETLDKEELLSLAQQDPFLITHPLTATRIEYVRNWVNNHQRCSDVVDKPEVIDAHQRLLAKLRGFLSPIDEVFKKYPDTDNSIYAHYARAAAYHRVPVDEKALAEIDALLKVRPDDPYFLELRGQILFEGGHVAESVAWYKKAVEALPGSPLLRVELAQAQLESTNDPAVAKEATAALKDAVREDDTNADAWHELGIAQGRAGNMGDASLALAEEAILVGDVRLAASQARRAADILPRGTPGWIRADDISRSAKTEGRDRG